MVIYRNYAGGYKAMYLTLLEDVWLSDIGRMAEVRNVPHLAWCEYGVRSKRKGKVSKYSEVSNVPHVACNV